MKTAKMAEAAILQSIKFQTDLRTAAWELTSPGMTPAKIGQLALSRQLAKAMISFCKTYGHSEYMYPLSKRFERPDSAYKSLVEFLEVFTVGIFQLPESFVAQPFPNILITGMENLSKELLDFYKELASSSDFKLPQQLVRKIKFSIVVNIITQSFF